MAMPDRNGGALVAVCLSDIDIKVRRHHGRVLLERAIKELGPFGVEFAAELHKAVEDPSDRVYWVPRKRYYEVMK
jgi:hypothetical protein